MSVLKPVKCVVLPSNPPIDKLIALKRVELDLRDEYRICLAFCDVNMPTREHYARWDKMCTPETGDAYLVDVGDKKYHKRGGSAAEVEKMSSETEGGRTWNYLVELANKNNQDGSLKQARHSVAKLLRDTYHVMNGNAGSSQGLVVEHGMDVVNGFFFRQSARDWNELFTNDEFVVLRQLWEGFNVSEKEVLPFTLPQYFRHLFLAGRSVAEITTKISWWLDKAKRVQVARDTARAKKYDVQMFNLACNGKAAGLIHVTDFFEAEAATYAWVGSGKLAVGIVKNELGQVHVQSSFRHPGLDFSDLAEWLSKAEPGRWYYETRFKSGPMLMNGSRQFTGVIPTSLQDHALKACVGAMVKLTKKQ
jgi:hypothetical protein